MRSLLKNLPNTLIFSLLFVFSVLIIYHYFKEDIAILEGLENNNDDNNSNNDSSNNDDNNSCGSTTATNSGQIEFLKMSLKELQTKVEKNTEQLAKLNEEKEQVKKNTKMINQNSNAILKATTSQLGK